MREWENRGEIEGKSRENQGKKIRQKRGESDSYMNSSSIESVFLSLGKSNHNGRITYSL
jgi:hypothetical protein